MSEWRKQAKCALLADECSDPDNPVPEKRSILWLFFDGFEREPSIRPTVRAMCDTCPVRAECLDDGLRNNETGVRAGVYLLRGHIDASKNTDMTQEQFESLRSLLE